MCFFENSLFPEKDVTEQDTQQNLPEKKYEPNFE